MKIFLMASRLFERRRGGAVRREATAADDPLDHPDIKRMSLRELADLPFERCRRERCK
jgi:hypothetical protein